MVRGATQSQALEVLPQRSACSVRNQQAARTEGNELAERHLVLLM